DSPRASKYTALARHFSALARAVPVSANRSAGDRGRWSTPVTSPLLATLSPPLFSSPDSDGDRADCLISGSPRDASTTGASPGAQGAIFGAIFPPPAAIESTPKNSWAASLRDAFCGAVGVRFAGGMSAYGISMSGVAVLWSGAGTNSYCAYGSKRAFSSFLSVVSTSACGTGSISSAGGNGGIGSRGRTTRESRLVLRLGFGN